MDNEIIDDKVREKMNKLEQQINILNNKVKDIEEKEEFTGNIAFREPIKNYYNR